MSENRRRCLLDDPLFRVRGPDGPVFEATLPEVLACLARGRVVSFEALQAHQRQAWRCFLTQLAAIALARAARAGPPDDANEWRGLLLALTQGENDAWSLVVEDVSRPAFMQPPAPEGSLAKGKYRLDILAPDDLEVLVASKNHDIKMRRVVNPRAEHWIYTLVTLQTQGGYPGVGNYGVVRMNGGFGNRPLVGVTPGLSWSEWFRRDVEVLGAARDDLVRQYEYDANGPALLWTLPWDGQKESGVVLNRCDPLFIEVCRRLRLEEADGALRCWRANTRGTRVAAPDELKGVTGDPWTPIDKKRGQALTVGARGFHYALLKDILLEGDYVRPAALEFTERDRGGAFVVATTLVRGQGKTEGLHRRIVEVRKEVIRLFGRPSERERLAKRAQARVEEAATVQKLVLWPALIALLQGGADAGRLSPDQTRKLSEKAGRWTRAFDAAVDDLFFEELWDSLDAEEEEARRQWQERLYRLAETQLRDAVSACPLPSIRRYRAVSRAEAIFYGSARKKLQTLFPPSEDKEKTDE